MTIEKLKSGNYRITKMVDGKRYRVTVDHRPTKREAEEIINDKIKCKVVSVNDSMTFTEAAEGYFTIKSNVLSPTTTRAYRCYLNNLPEQFTRLRLGKVDHIAIQKLINDITPRYSPKSIHNIHGFISAVLGLYYPALKLHTSLPQKVKYEASTPSEVNVEQIIEANRGTKYEVPFRLWPATACGNRRSAPLRWKIWTGTS